MNSEKKISVAELRRKLPVGQHFMVTFVGKNARFAPPHRLHTERKVLKNSSYEMESLIIQEDKPIHLTWKGLSCHQIGDSYILSDEHQGDFLKIELITTERE